MLARTVHAIAAAECIHTTQHVILMPRGYTVEVKRDNIPALNIICFAAVAEQRTADKASDIFQIILLRLLEVHILCETLCASRRHF